MIHPFNSISLVLVCIFLLASILLKKKRPISGPFIQLIENKYFELTFIVVIMIVSAALRLIGLDTLPAGMNQDEASIGYDAWALANYGVDRNGYHNPVYPVAWGAGHGPFYMYVVSVFIKVFGNSLFVYRLPQALLGILSIYVFYLLLKKIADRFTAYTGALLLTVSPWHIMSSRWALDANPAPFLILIGLYFFVRGCHNKKTGTYALAGMFFSLSLYTYASTYIVLPVMLTILVIYALARHYITIKQLIISGLVCMAVALPLAVFWIINIFKLPEIHTALFSVPRLTAMRSNSVFIPLNRHIFGNVISNVGSLFSLLFSYPIKEVINVIDGFNIIYVFTFPLFLLGGFLSFKRAVRLKSTDYDFVMCAWFTGSFLLSILLHQNINRINVLFIPVIYFVTVGIRFLAEKQREMCANVLCMILAAAGLFVQYYTGPEYRHQIGFEFMDGYGEAVRYADSLNKNIVYCVDQFDDENVRGGYVLLMYYCEIDPVLFHKTVQYDYVDSEFRKAKSFDRYRFILPQNMLSDAYQEDVFVLPADYAGKFDSRFNIVIFGNFIVVSRSSQ